MRLTITLVFLLSVLPAAWAQNMTYNSSYCSNETIRGTYSVSCTGWITPAPSAAMAQFSTLATIVIDPSGKVTGGGKASIGGTIVDQTVTGTSSTAANCTGTVSYDQKINGQPAPKLNIVFHVVGNGDEMRGMSVDAGTAMICSLRRMSIL